MDRWFPVARRWTLGDCWPLRESVRRERSFRETAQQQRDAAPELCRASPPAFDYAWEWEPVSWYAREYPHNGWTVAARRTGISMSRCAIADEVRLSMECFRCSAVPGSLLNWSSRRTDEEDCNWLTSGLVGSVREQAEFSERSQRAHNWGQKWRGKVPSEVAYWSIYLTCGF